MRQRRQDPAQRTFARIEVGNSRIAQRMRKLRKFRKVVIGGGVADSGFGQADFMLFKQLLYFERYGKMYLADTALLGDRPFLEHVLSLSPS